MPYERTEVSAQEIERQKEICARVRSALGSGERFAMVDTYGCQQNESDSEVLRGYLRSMGYTMTDDDIEELTPYGKSLFQYKKSGKSDTIILTGSNAKFLSYLSRIQKPCLASYTVNGKTLNYTPVQAFREIPDNANAKNYFENMFSEWKSIWK